MSNIFAIDCSNNNCGTGLLQGAGANQDGCFPKADDSTVDTIILLDPVLGTPVNWSASMTLTDWDINNADATGVQLKRFIGKGSVTDEEGDTFELAAGVESSTDSIYTLPFTMPITSKEMRDYWRAVKCGSFRPKFYYTTPSSHVFGGANAINPKKIVVQFPHEEDSFQKILVTFTWEAKTAPDREDSPLPTAAQM
ncbi:MAG: hypothetical protein ACRBFS_19445 [Aureispira sp.]